MAGTYWRADLPLHPHPQTLPPSLFKEILRLLPFATPTMMMDAKAALPTAAMADCCISGCQWPTLASSPPKPQRQPAGDRIHALAAVRDTDDNDLARACRGPSGESAVAACRLFFQKNATICCQLITVPPRFFYPRPRGPYDGRGASTIRRGTRRIVEQDENDAKSKSQHQFLPDFIFSDPTKPISSIPR